MFLQRGASVASDIARFKQHQLGVLVNNFAEEYQHLNKGAVIAFIQETQEASDVIEAADFERAPEEAFKLLHSFDVTPVLQQEKRN